MNKSAVKQLEKSALPILGVTEDSRSIVMPLRLLLSVAALIIVAFNPLVVHQTATLIILGLMCHGIYSVALLLLMLHSGLRLPFRAIALLDVAWGILFIALSHGADSIFFPFILFAVLSAAFCGGIKMGIQTTLASAALFIAVSGGSALAGLDPDVNRNLIRTVAILLFGYMASYCGGAALLYKRRLLLLREMTRVSNPRLGVEHAIKAVLHRLSVLYDSRYCLFITHEAGPGTYKLRSLNSGGVYNAGLHDTPPDIIRQLMGFPEATAVVHSKRSWTRLLFRNHFACDVVKGCRSDQQRELSANIIELLDAETFLSIPLWRHGKSIGRLYLTFDRRYAAGPADIDFILHVCEQAIPMLDHIELLERLATSAADDERNRIALDIHDSLIQPYIGLQIGLQAIRQQFSLTNGDGVEHPAAAASDNNAARTTSTFSNGNARSDAKTPYRDIERLCTMADSGVADLRKYVRRLKGDDTADDRLTPAVRRYAAKLEEATGITIEVQADDDIEINGRLATDTFQMICEGLSNVRRHTLSERAAIKLVTTPDSLLLSIDNFAEAATRETVPPFTPRSISERAQALGGNVAVRQTENYGTSVEVVIPL